MDGGEGRACGDSMHTNTIGAGGSLNVGVRSQE